jgi:hypothetical protein
MLIEVTVDEVVVVWRSPILLINKVVAWLVDLRELHWNASLTRSTLSSKGPGRPARFVIHRHPSRCNFSYHCFMPFFTGGSFPNLVRKRRCTVKVDSVRAYSSTRNAFSAHFPVFTQPAPLAATYITKHPWHVQKNLESFSFSRYVACYHPLRHSSVPFFCIGSGNYE